VETPVFCFGTSAKLFLVELQTGLEFSRLQRPARRNAPMMVA